MARCLFIVADAFLITGRGVILLPGLLPNGDERFRVGDPIVLKRPDGSRIEARMDGIEVFSPMKPEFPILLKGLGKEDVPVGTEVWSVTGDGTDTIS